MKNRWVGSTVLLVVLLGFGTSSSADVLFSTNADFDLGTMVGVNHDIADELRINTVASTFPFIWIAKSGAGTIVKINTETGQILGEYYSAPNGRFRNPSRTTVDQEGNVWVGNRDESSSLGGVQKGSVVKIGLLEANQCVDRNGDGVITTSVGLGDVKPWTNTGLVDDDGGVDTAADECILKYVRTSGLGVRSVAVDQNNNVWVGGGAWSVSNDYQIQNLINGSTGAIIKTVTLGYHKCGSYGALVDGNGILWSAGLGGNMLLRLDPSVDPPTWSCLYTQNRYTYGLGLDNDGYVWNANWEHNTILKFAPNGAIAAGPFSTDSGARGVAVTSDNDVWVANSHSNTVVRFLNSGARKATIGVGAHPTGLAVDAAGKVWVTNYNSHNAMRINPATNAVDLVVSLGAGAYPYNYSDMTGMVSRSQTSPQGSWTVVHDSGGNGNVWESISWNDEPQGDVPPGASITVETRAANTEAGLGGVGYVPVSSGGAVSGVSGRFLQVRATLRPNSGGESPVLSDLTVYQGGDCDVNDDGAVNRTDINLIGWGRGGHDDLLDIDNDGLVTVLDARKCTLLCSKPLCAL